MGRRVGRSRTSQSKTEFQCGPHGARNSRTLRCNMEGEVGSARCAASNRTSSGAIAWSDPMKTRIGFIGAGGIANRHISNLLTFEDVTVVAVADPRRDRAEAVAARVGARAYDGHDPMLDSETLDAVYICTPPFAHGVPEIASVTHKLPFFVEKPVAADLATAEEIEPIAPVAKRKEAVEDSQISHPG